VVSYDAKSNYYKVRYEDGDQEEMEDKDIKRFLVENTTTQPIATRYPIGTKIYKNFDGVFYSGEITDYDAETEYSKITYEDGDQEEIENKDIKQYLLPPPQEPPQEPPQAPPQAPLSRSEASKHDGKERKFRVLKRTKKAINAGIDKNRFLRNPCCVAGGKQNPPEDYANTGRGAPINSYYHLIQRLSDRNYAMRGLCIDGDGLSYTSFTKTDMLYPVVVFLPETNLNDHSKNPTILDACHLDMIHPTTGACLLTETNLLQAVSPETECIFLNGFQNGGPSRRDKQKVDPNVVVKMINACKDNLKCFALTECIVSNEILGALASCKKLMGLTFYTTQACSGSSPGSTQADDKGLAAIIKACTDLRWLYVVDCDFFRDASWKAISNNDSPTTACPNLEVLWVTSHKSTRSRHHVCYGDHDAIRRTLSDRASTLKVCMINCDTELKSRHIIGGAKGTDRLGGDAGSLDD